MKKIKFVGVFIIFILACIFHFGYSKFSCFISSILFPVNESIWEHMKLFVTPVYLFSFFEWLIYKKKKIKYNNFLFSYGVAIVISIIGYLVIYLIVNHFIGHKALIAIILLLTFFFILQYISYKIINYKEITMSKLFGILIMVTIFVVMGCLTYYPGKSFIFYDYQKKIFGIK